jgi:hypothetical protein
MLDSNKFWILYVAGHTLKDQVRDGNIRQKLKVLNLYDKIQQSK